MNGDTRYTPVTGALPMQLPALTREEATRAARKLYAHFGGTEHGSVDMQQRARWRSQYRSKRGALPSWVSKAPTPNFNHDKGWGALIHDVSHDIHDQRTPRLRPHDGAHAKLEAEVAAYVVAKGWLDGRLRAKEQPKATTEEKRLARLAGMEQRLAKWRTKQTRAANAIRKLKRQHAAALRIIAKGAA